MSRRAVSGPLPNPAGAPPLDYWEIPTQPYPGAHYATFPDKLAVKPIKAMCPSKVCRVCGEPSRRITEIDKTTVPSRMVSAATEGRHSERVADTMSPQGRVQAPSEREGERTNGTASVTLGWTDCNHNDWRAGVVLDPFAGSGTALAVATGHGRDAIGVDLDERNAALALERVGPLFMTVEHLTETAPLVPTETVESDLL